MFDQICKEVLGKFLLIVEYNLKSDIWAHEGSSQTENLTYGAVLGNDASADMPVVADSEEADAYDWRASTSARDLYITDYQNQTIRQEYWSKTVEELITMYNDETLEMNDDKESYLQAAG